AGMSSGRPDALALVGCVLGGRFRVVQHLGSGGAGHVYLGERVREPGARRVALKVLRQEHRKGPAIERFSREAHAAARVRHPNVLEIVEVHVDDAEHPFFVMELLVGLDLADTLAYARALSPARAARIAYAAADGLAAAHAAGVVHGDVKPENLFLVHAPDGREVVKLVDFGFASLREPPPAAEARASTPGEPTPRSGRRVAVGTPEYMAPEQAAGLRGDPRSDVYSLGVVLFEMLTGSVPFTGAYPALVERHAREPPPRPRAVRPDLAASDEMEALVLQALAKDPSLRFASMAAFRDALATTREASGVYRRSDLVK
ncbi:MAG TPA: serine/threonine-protein kinase, partial [Minicystis sp.]|nr:serine/threonine-protein kinase [Minicystis sp.]